MPHSWNSVKKKKNVETKNFNYNLVINLLKEDNFLEFLITVNYCAARTADTWSIDYQPCSRPGELNSADITKKAKDVLI